MTTYECDGCGACCRTFPIFASESDAEREPRVAAEGRRLPQQLAGDEWHYRLFPLPFLEACTFLDNDDRCSIYSTRPDVCRRFAAGSEQCHQARERQGLPVLEASQPP
jgi:Fe-S-cluster containining protein